MHNFELMLTSKHSLFSHCVQEANDIWYLGRSVNALPRYQIQFPSYIKWSNSECLKVRICLKFFASQEWFSQMGSHI